MRDDLYILKVNGEPIMTSKYLDILNHEATRDIYDEHDDIRAVHIVPSVYGYKKCCSFSLNDDIGDDHLCNCSEHSLTILGILK